ncbi:splicing factor ESS-2 homolog [Atheta coriaria]|uniref:splicing factor ESS-2 homolog n=1 Tax=Dalotia coriaria TaxID=877792 RepID=UPI0031F383CB
MESPKTPGQNAIVAMQEFNKAVVFKVPKMVKKKRAQLVLDDDRFVEELGKIIERDFFPDLEKLKAKTEYLEAVENNDVIKIRELHLKYTGSRRAPSRLPSPATFETPANIHNSQDPAPSPVHSQPSCETNDKTQKLSLDQYLNSHTSEDNQSFEEIMTESERKHRLKYSYLYQEEDKSLQDQQNALALPSVEQQAALPAKKLNIDTWTYKNKNYIMYVPDGVDLTPEEEIEYNKKRQEVVHSNTRLQLNPFNDSQSKETITELAKKQARGLDGKIGVDGKELLTGTPQINGFGLVRTPSPCPGVAESPLMTWGEVEGTPFRLDGSDTPLMRTQGPSFKMNAPPKREQLAFALAEKASERHRDKKKKAMDAARKQFQSPSPYTGSSRERLFSMSPAAQRLATSKLRLDLSRTPRTPKTPLMTTIGTPKRNLGIKKSDDNLTDDLLKIKVPRRQTASDFF